MKRTMKKIPNHPGISRILVLDEKTGNWVEPKRGAKFRAKRYITTENGKRKPVYDFFDTLAEAKVFRAKAEDQIVSSVVELEKPKIGMTFGELVQIWREVWLPNKDLSTQLRYKSYLKHFQFFWDMPVEKIEPSDVDRWIAYIKRPEYLAMGHTTRCGYDHEFSVLRVILNFYASRFNRNYRLPFIKDHKPMLKVKQKMKIVKDLTVGEFEKFMNSLREVCTEFDSEAICYLAMMQYAIYSRVQEAAALHYEDFNFERGKLTINKKVQWLRAKGYDDRIVDGSKANGGKEIPIPELAAKVFREWVMKSGIRSGLLFRLKDELITYRQIEYRYTQALKRAGLPFRATHLLRHASLTEFYETCSDLLLTAKMAGQKDLRSTMRYAKVRDEKVIQTQKKMDEKLSKLMS